jgi:cell division cycle 2-like protein
LLLAIEYFHLKNIMHRDLKTSNLLYNNKGQLKVCDFGLGRKCVSANKPQT